MKTDNYIRNMTNAELESEIEKNKSPFEKWLDEEVYKRMLHLEKLRRLKEELTE